MNELVEIMLSILVINVIINVSIILNGTNIVKLSYIKLK